MKMKQQVFCDFPLNLYLVNTLMNFVQLFSGNGKLPVAAVSFVFNQVRCVKEEKKSITQECKIVHCAAV